MRRSFYLTLVIGMVALAGCRGTVLKDNQVYTAGRDANGENVSAGMQINTEGRMPFKSIDVSQFKDLGILVTVSPDGKTALFMQGSFNSAADKVIKGEELTHVDMIKYEIDTKKETVIDIAVPFVSSAKWNKAGDKVAYISGDRLHVHDLKKNRTDIDTNSRVSYFEWSPDGKKIYTEHPNLENGSIMYVDSGQSAHAYDNSEDLYFKGVLDDNCYYGTKRYLIEQQVKDEIQKGLTKEEAEKKIKLEGKGEKVSTVITDKNKVILKELPGGRFRDSYKKAMLQTGLEGFELQYYPDINKQGSTVLTKEFIYDAKFIDGGRIVYITKGTNIENNDFILHLVDSQGKELKNTITSSSRICLSPNGKTGYGSGPDRLEINFDEFLNSNRGIKAIADKRLKNDTDDIYAVVRGAMDAYYKPEMVKGADESGVSKYFINSSNPEQWAYFDTLARVQERKKLSLNSECYILHIGWNDYKNEPTERKPYVRFSPMSDKPRASANISVSVRNSFGSAMGMEHAIELVKENNKWYVTGLSTFPYSSQAKEIRKKAEQFVKQIQDKGSYNGALKGKQVTVGQVQFWRLSDPHLSPDVNSANFCKVYLKVNEDGKEVIYTMVLDKKYQRDWKVNSLRKDQHSGLL